MKIHNEPAAQFVLAKLEKLHPIIHNVLDKATTEARGFFEQRECEVDTALYPDLVRYFAKEILQDPTSNTCGLILNVLNKNGLLLIYEQDETTYKLRVRKADEDGEFPLNSLSETMKQFLKQRPPLLPGLEDLFDLPKGSDNSVQTSALKLVIVWDVDSQFVLSDVWLACFKNEAGATHFVGAIPHAATAIAAPGTFDDAAEELEDLAISIEQTGSGSE